LGQNSCLNFCFFILRKLFFAQISPADGSALSEKQGKMLMFHNDVVMTFNNKIQTFPNNMFANMLNFKEQPLFEATEAEKKNVKVKF